MARQGTLGNQMAVLLLFVKEERKNPKELLSEKVIVKSTAFYYKIRPCFAPQNDRREVGSLSDCHSERSEES